MTSNLNLHRDCTGILNVSDAKIKQKRHVWSDGAVTMFCPGAVEGSLPAVDAPRSRLSAPTEHRDFTLSKTSTDARNQGARLGHQTPSETYVCMSGKNCSSRLSLWLMNMSVGKAQTYHTEKRQNILSLFWSQKMRDRNPDSPSRCLAVVCAVNRRLKEVTLREEQKASREAFFKERLVSTSKMRKNLLESWQ